MFGPLDLNSTTEFSPVGLSMPDADRSSIVLLSEDDNGQALVSMKDGDKFVIAVSDAARACRARDKEREFLPQFNLLLDRLTAWLGHRRSRIKSAHLTFRDRDILFLVMQKQVRFDQSLMDDLVQLDIEVANARDLSLIQLEVLCIPAVSARSSSAFLASGEVLTYAE